MEFKRSHRLPARREAVWAALGDPAVLKACLPGCESVERVADDELTLVVAVEVGAFKATFTGNVKLASATPPSRAKLTAEGRGRPAGAASGTADITLVDERGGTMVTLTADVKLGGKLAAIDEAQVAAKARTLADRFFQSLADWLRRNHGGFVDRLDHTPAGVPLLGDEASEDVVEDKAERAGQVAEAAEERLELAAARGVLGGPYVWGVLALAIMVAFLAIIVSARP